MRCYGNFSNDRICDLCKKLNPTFAFNCELKANENKEKINNFKVIKQVCKNLYIEYHEYEKIELCKLNNEICLIDNCKKMH